MRVLEEPFVTRDGILRIMHPTELVSDRPLATLRRNRATSAGVRFELRTSSGRLLGRVQLYSSLNSDAARAFRRHSRDLAQELAHRARQIETSEPARRVQAAIGVAAARLPSDLLGPDTPAPLRRYLDLRRRSSWAGPDPKAFLGEWVAQSAAWLPDRHDDLADALLEMDRALAQARADLIPPAEASARTFYGVLARMDELQAEIDGGDGQVFSVARDQLEREGLAAVGQPVAVLEELLPGGIYSRLMPAIALDDAPEEPSPYDQELPGPNTYMDAGLGDRDRDWLRRTLERAPRPVPSAPLRVV